MALAAGSLNVLLLAALAPFVEEAGSAADGFTAVAPEDAMFTRTRKNQNAVRRFFRGVRKTANPAAGCSQ